jgi:hypothetical protein
MNCLEGESVGEYTYQEASFASISRMEKERY